MTMTVLFRFVVHAVFRILHLKDEKCCTLKVYPLPANTMGVSWIPEFELFLCA